MEIKITNTTIVDEWWLDDDTYVVYCGTFEAPTCVGTKGYYHLEVEYWESENSFHFIGVAEDTEIWEVTLEELSQEERDKLIKHIKEKIK